MAKKPEHMVRKGQRRPPSLGFLDSWAVYSLITTLFADLLKRRLQNEVLGYLRSWVVGLFECDKLIEKINIQSDVTKNAKEKKHAASGAICHFTKQKISTARCYSFLSLPW